MSKLLCWDRVTPQIRKLTEDNLTTTFDDRIVTTRPQKEFPSVKVIKWTDVYVWMRQQNSEWARRLTEYMEILERRLIYLSLGGNNHHLGRPVVVEPPFRLFADEIPRNDADRFHILAPLVGVKEGARNLAKHR